MQSFDNDYYSIRRRYVNVISGVGWVGGEFIKYMYTEVSIEAVMRHQMVSVHSEHVYKLNMYTYTLRCNHSF